MNDYNLAADYAALGDDLMPGILPDGNYVGVVKRAVPGQTQNGKGKIVVTLEVIEGPQAGREATEQLTWSPESEVARRIFSTALAIMGAPPEWVLEAQASFTDVAERITGAVVEFNAKEDEWNGQPRNRINFRKAVSIAPQPVAAVPSLGTPAAPQQQASQPQTAAVGSWPTL